MKANLTRRDFLKLAGLTSAGLVVPRLGRLIDRARAGDPASKNVIVIVFDAFSACHLPLLGYPRETTPNLNTLAERAVVYHNHYAGGNFTTPGTATLLTGTLPWTHRAIAPGGIAKPFFADHNLFSAFPDHHRIAYTHNAWADNLLGQFRMYLDERIPWRTHFIHLMKPVPDQWIERDADTILVAWTRIMGTPEDRYGYSLLLSPPYAQVQEAGLKDLRPQFPRGLPAVNFAGGEYLLETAIDSSAARLSELEQPFLAYLHFLPPHDPYHAPLEFHNRFSYDSFREVSKPVELPDRAWSPVTLRERRAAYDEFILYADREFGRLYEMLESSGLLENTWVILTSDHGEMFERGILGHVTHTLYQPSVRIPLFIFEPGRASRLDVYAPTSAVDLLPTLAHLTGQKIPDWTEGAILPPYAPQEPDPDRRVYALQAARNTPTAPLQHASVMLIHGRHKLVYKFGYANLGIDEQVQLFDLQEDPDELMDLSPSRHGTASELLAELKMKLLEADQAL